MRRIVIGAAVVALLVPGTSAMAARARTVCNVLPDKADDTTIATPGAPMKSSAHDIRAFDVATGAKTVVVVMKMATANLASDPLATGGMAWNASFKIGDVNHAFSRRVGPNGQVLSETATAGGQPIGGLTVKADATSITWTVPRANIAKLKGRNVVLSTFFAGTSSPTLVYDQAPDGGGVSSARYVDRTPSCLKPA